MTEQAQPLTAAEIAALAELEAQATPGPWGIVEGNTNWWYVLKDGRPFCVFTPWIDNGHDPFRGQRRTNAELTVKVRNALPRLLATVQAQAAELAKFDSPYYLRLEESNAELQAEIEQLRRQQRTGTIGGQGSHWEGCWKTHIDCAAARIEKLEAEIERLRAALATVQPYLRALAHTDAMADKLLAAVSATLGITDEDDQALRRDDGWDAAYHAATGDEGDVGDAQ